MWRLRYWKNSELFVYLFIDNKIENFIIFCFTPYSSFRTKFQMNSIHWYLIFKHYDIGILFWQKYHFPRKLSHQKCHFKIKFSEYSLHYVTWNNYIIIIHNLYKSYIIIPSIVIHRTKVSITKRNRLWENEKERKNEKHKMGKREQTEFPIVK